MSDKNPDTHAFSDLERPYPVVAESIGGDQDAPPLAVRLGDLWSDLIRAADEARDPDIPKKASSAVPLLDEMKGIQQWD
jgi:hypothetical protein